MPCICSNVYLNVQHTSCRPVVWVNEGGNSKNNIKIKIQYCYSQIGHINGRHCAFYVWKQRDISNKGQLRAKCSGRSIRAATRAQKDLNPEMRYGYVSSSF